MKTEMIKPISPPGLTNNPSGLEIKFRSKIDPTSCFLIHHKPSLEMTQGPGCLCVKESVQLVHCSGILWMTPQQSYTGGHRKPPRDDHCNFRHFKSWTLLQSTSQTLYMCVPGQWKGNTGSQGCYLQQLGMLFKKQVQKQHSHSQPLRLHWFFLALSQCNLSAYLCGREPT